MLKKILLSLTFYKFALYYEFGEVGITHFKNVNIKYKRCVLFRKPNGPETWFFQNGVIYGEIQYELGVRVNHIIQSWNEDSTRWCIERPFGFMTHQGPLIKFNYGN